MNLPVFITGNQHKADYLNKMLGLPLEHRKADLDEIQAIDLELIVEHKVKQAYRQLGVPVLVEDVGLKFKALGGLPGPFVKFFVETSNGLENMCRMLDSFQDRRAIAECVFGYYDGIRLEMFKGSLEGMIAQHPHGSSGFGWDKIFEPIGYDGRSRAELNEAEDIATYSLIKPLAALREFLKET
ncbi:MAG TPA: non-canonical purine NTP pyrophosphatase [Candidatus Saccharimonadales bacterium]|nr:non-canonical purine NTP pyrophosphatase [Candidatus Saccharimonadales bacterium]